MAPTEALDSEYENGIADLLAYLAGDSAHVERNVRLPGVLSGVGRQIDVLVQGRIYGQEAATLAVDAKRWRSAVDVSDVGAFIDLVKDVEADYGLLVSNRGSSRGGRTRAQHEVAVQVDVMPVEQLLAWRPKGTFTISYRVLEVDHQEAAHSLRRAGFRVAESTQWEPSGGCVVIDIFRHYGASSPGAGAQDGALERIAGILAKAKIEGTLVAHGTVMDGGTPGHRWLQVTMHSEPSDLKILAATEMGARDQLVRVATAFGVPVDALGYIRPEGWPAPRLFPDWGVRSGVLMVEPDRSDLPSSPSSSSDTVA